MPSEPVLSDLQRAFLEPARRAVLGTIARDGRPRLVPICFVVDDDQPLIYTPLDDKPKRGDDPLSLARVRDILADPRVTVLVDQWDEEWTRLAWLRCTGTAIVLPPSAGDAEHTAAINALRAKYLQYEGHGLESRPLIRITVERATDWGPLGGTAAHAR